MPGLSAALTAILKGVSRSFYLSMQVLPEAVREPIALGYLLARAADTIADTEAVPGPQRRELLGLLRAGIRQDTAPERVQAELDRAVLGSLAGGNPAERELLRRSAECLRLLYGQPADDERRLRRVLEQLLFGMDRDLSRFAAQSGTVPPEQVVALATLQDLDEYTYFAAGCVGEFWTAVTAAHVPEVAHLQAPDLLARGVALGKCLQLVNVLRDVAADLRAGRCYWPTDVLAAEGLTPQGLAALAQPGAAPPSPEVRAALAAVTRRLMRLCEDHAAASWPYVQAIPASAVRLRLACLWPLLLGMRTLALLSKSDAPLVQATPIKVRRPAFYALLAESTGAALVDAARARDQAGLLSLVAMRHAVAARAASH